MKNKPRIRFKGFTEDWEQRKLSDVLRVNSGKDYKHLDQGNIPVYGTGGYMLSVNESLSNIDAIGIGRKGTIDKPQYLKAPFWTVDTLFYLTALGKYSILFLYYLMQLIPWKKFDESTGVPSLSKTTIDSISAYVPSNSEEEESISALFNQLDKSITLHQRKLEKLKLAKKALLQKLFPKNGSKFPELRFKGFADAWEQRKLGDYLSIPEKEILEVDSSDDLITVKLNLGGVELGASRDTLSLGSTVYYKRYAGQFIYGKQNFFNGSMGLIPTNLDGKGSSGDVPSFNISNIEENYLYTYVSRESYWRSKVAAASGTGSKRIHEKTFLDFNIDVPSMDEQKLISNTFDLVDRFITLHQRKLDKLQEVKKGLLQKMFV